MDNISNGQFELWECGIIGVRKVAETGPRGYGLVHSILLYTTEYVVQDVKSVKWKTGKKKKKKVTWGKGNY